MSDEPCEQSTHCLVWLAALTKSYSKLKSSVLCLSAAVLAAAQLRQIHAHLPCDMASTS